MSLFPVSVTVDCAGASAAGFVSLFLQPPRASSSAREPAAMPRSAGTDEECALADRCVFSFGVIGSIWETIGSYVGG